MSVGCATVPEWVDALSARVRVGDHAHHHVSLNAAKWVALRHDAALRAAIRHAEPVAADGVSIVALSQWLGTPLPGRTPGIDIAEGLLTRASRRGWSVALLGARPAVCEAVIAWLGGRGIPVVFAADGFTSPPETWTDAIARAQPDLLFVALGSPRAERFVSSHAHCWPGTVAMGVGGAFDVWAGAVPRAPRWARASGLEWAARFAREPRRRFRRAIVASAAFVAATLVGARVPA